MEMELRAQVLPTVGTGTQSSLDSQLAISGPVINGTQTYLGTGPQQGRLVDGAGNDVVALFSGRQQNVALIQARAFYSSIGVPSSYPQTLSATTGSSYIAAPSGNAVQTYASDGSAATITADGNSSAAAGSVPSNSPASTSPTDSNPYGDARLTVHQVHPWSPAELFKTLSPDTDLDAALNEFQTAYAKARAGGQAVAFSWYSAAQPGSFPPADDYASTSYQSTSEYYA